jgi:hypothetical protein
MRAGCISDGRNRLPMGKIPSVQRCAAQTKPHVQIYRVLADVIWLGADVKGDSNVWRGWNLNIWARGSVHDQRHIKFRGCHLNQRHWRSICHQESEAICQGPRELEPTAIKKLQELLNLRRFSCELLDQVLSVARDAARIMLIASDRPASLDAFSGAVS